MSTMSGGKRKSRKPQKWEDYVADEEQLASIEKELEKEEKARMQNLDDDDSNKDRESEEDVKEEDEGMREDKERRMSEDEMQLEIDMSRGEEDQDLGECERRSKEESDGELEDRVDAGQSIPLGEVDQIIGECKSCGIQLRDWSSTHSHLRFHRLSHVPYCINWSSCVAPQTKRITCQVCQRHCQTKDVLAYHAYTEHYRGDLKMCPFCSSTFKNMKEFQEHLDFDTVSLRCHVCETYVNEEHKYYQHVAECIANKYPEATSVVCHICKKVTEVFQLCDHLMQHSTLPNLSRHLSQKNRRRPVIPPKSDNSRQQQSRFRPFLCEICDRRFVVYSEFKRHLYSHFKSRSFVCTHCGRSYCQKNTLIVHLYSYHNASLKAEEIAPKEDTTQRVCDLCGRAGFLSDELLIRHCILRCSQRNNLQLSFAAIVSSLAKKLNLCFSETLSHNAMHTYLKLGLEAWEKPACVHECLEKLLSNKNDSSVSSGGRREAIEFSDVQLLAYLDHFEEKNREQDKDLEFLLNPRNKDENPTQDLPCLDEIQSADIKRKVEGGMSGEESPAASSVRSKDGEISGQDYHGASYTSGEAPPSDSPLNLRRLMQHLGRNNDKRKAGDGDEGGQIDICLVTSTTNTQVTITPAGDSAQEMKPPKIARSISHKPSVEEIRDDYPGVTVLKSVDFSRIPALLLEMQEMMENKAQKEMDEAGILPTDVQRLEVEAQLLREAEPFYLNQDLKWKLPGSNGNLREFKQEMCNNISVPDNVADFISSTKDIYDQLNSKHNINGSSLNSLSKGDSVPSDKDILRLLKEAQELSSSGSQSLKS
ncbi:uncharacterized protein LOC122253203 isoform X2 [Penaeus japonicus]|nr:uncharacterized protein LOC122253203 isoform X2 [Penaeus japonicus]XP_042872013.1 uncharacterized protein LOC122253203 isoform X2 [Penaeus japonicus]